MNHVHSWLIGLTFAVGLVLTLALTVRPTRKHVASAKSEPSTTRIPVDPLTTRIPVEAPTTSIPATDRPTTKIPIVPAAPFGPGSAHPTLEGGGPAGWLVKGRADTRLYYTPDDRAYDATTANVGLKDEDSAARADFTPWRRSAKNR